MSEKSPPVLNDEQDPPRMYFPNWSVNGTGIRFYGGKPLSATTFEVTRWITVICIPVLPLSTWEIQPAVVEDAGMGVRHRFHIVAKRPFNFKHVLLAYLFVVLAAVPCAICLYLPYWTTVPLAIGVVVWAVLFLAGGLYRHDSVYWKVNRTSNPLTGWFRRDSVD